jgi:hypothetical protein
MPAQLPNPFLDMAAAVARGEGGRGGAELLDAFSRIPQQQLQQQVDQARPSADQERSSGVLTVFAESASS